MSDDEDDAQFDADPLAEQYREFGRAGKETIDPSNTAAGYVHLGRMGNDLMFREHERDPDAYDRPAAVAKLQAALRVSGVPEAMCKPNELLGIFWVAKLDSSIPGSEHGPRSFQATDYDDGWFGGNITLGSLRVLTTAIVRVSRPNELDVWEFKPGMEATSRDIIKRLRRGELSISQIEAILKRRKSELTQSESKSDAHSRAIDARTSEKSKESQLAKLNKLTNELADYAVGTLHRSQEEVRDYLESKQVIPPLPKTRTERPSVKSLAKTITPSEAKELIQELAILLAKDPSRKDVLVSVAREVNAAVGRMRESSTPTERRPLPTLQPQA